MQIDSDFEGGSIQVLDECGDGSALLSLRPDSASDDKQWFYFRVSGAEGVPCSLQITDAGQSSFPGGWQGYRACASYDGEEWFRVPADLEGDALILRHVPEREVVAYACYAPYSLDRHKALLQRARRSRLGKVIELGRSMDHRPISAVVLGDQGRPVRRVWIIAHQHPGETMAGWFMEGLLDRMLDEEDEVAQVLLEKAEVY